MHYSRDVHDASRWALSDDLDPDCRGIGTIGGVHLGIRPKFELYELTRVAKKEGRRRLTIVHV